MVFTTHPHLAPRLRMIGAVPLLPLCAFIALYRRTLPSNEAGNLANQQRFEMGYMLDLTATNTCLDGNRAGDHPF
jgi:hypothetical protein